MLKNKTPACRSQAGFTLVELAIVMIIVGLLIAGVLKGQALIGNAQITTTVAQMKSIEAATTTFKDQYGNLPGDLPNASARLTNCAGACYYAANAGNGVLDVLPSATAQGTEGESFFLQLFNTSLLTGIQPGPGDVSSAVTGKNFPATKISGGVLMASSAATRANFPVLVAPAAFTPQVGSYLTISGAVAAPTVGLTGAQAGAIDSKIDDGQPDTGSVFAGPAACGTAAAAAVAGFYNSGNNPICYLFSRVQN